HFGLVSEVLLTPKSSAHSLFSESELLVTYDKAVAAVEDIKGNVGLTATFDGTTSIGFIIQYKWNWVSVPAGSLISNSAQPYPDSGGTFPVDMTSNALLYHAEETVGSTGFDTSGSSNDASLTAITLGAPGQVGSRSWNLTSGISKIQPASSVAIPGDWTISYWFYGLAPNTSWRTGARGDSSTHHIIVETGGDRLGIYEGGFQAVTPTFNMPSASYTGWHHIAAVGADGDTTFYVDGEFVGRVLGYQSTDPINTIGNYQGDNQRFSDRIDEIAIWNRKLFGSEVADIYALQEGNFAGTGPTFDFIPDLNGTYTVNLTVRDGTDLTLSTDTANCSVGILTTIQGLRAQSDLVQGMRTQIASGRKKSRK
ncbi:MAG: LamG domain-containing protein, partial [Candidatus Thorarchaeota archaeon]